ncbi:MAG: hypothetical protein SFT94_05885 [Pseudanabaenaceae cyanobacterium bins.68]|nr:hypothetical protein [Pseudanabaenaceae cyanobacterium bins.68]
MLPVENKQGNSEVTAETIENTDFEEGVTCVTPVTSEKHQSQENSEIENSDRPKNKKLLEAHEVSINHRDTGESLDDIDWDD